MKTYNDILSKFGYEADEEPSQDTASIEQILEKYGYGPAQPETAASAVDTVTDSQPDPAEGGNDPKWLRSLIEFLHGGAEQSMREQDVRDAAQMTVASKVLQGKTLNALNLEEGTLGVPLVQNFFPQTKLELGANLKDALGTYDLSEEAQAQLKNPYYGGFAEIVGSLGTTGKLSRSVFAGVNRLGDILGIGTKLANVGDKATKAGKLIGAGKRVVSAGITGGIIGGTRDTDTDQIKAQIDRDYADYTNQAEKPVSKEEFITTAYKGGDNLLKMYKITPTESTLQNMRNGSIWGAGLQVVGEGFGAIINSSEKMIALKRFKDELAKWAYGDGQYSSLKAAKQDIGKMINNDIKRMGGLGNVNSGKVKKMFEFVQRKTTQQPSPINVTPSNVTPQASDVVSQVAPAATASTSNATPTPQIVPPVVSAQAQPTQYTGPERRVDLETRKQVDEGKVTPEQMAELRRQQAFLEERKQQREAEEAAKQQAKQAQDKPVTLKQRQEQVKPKQTSSITINRVDQEPFTVKRGDRVRVYLGKDEAGQSRFEEMTVIGVSPTKKTVRVVSDNAVRTGGVEYDQGHVYPLEKKIELAQSKEKKVISVDKAPPGGWTEKDRVPSPKQDAPVAASKKGESATFESVSDFGKRVKKGDVTAQEVRDQFQFMLDHEADIKQSIMDYINSSDKYKRKRKDTKAKLVDDTFDRELQRLGYAGDNMLSYSRPLDGGDYRQSMIGAIKKNLDKLTDEAIQAMAAKNKEYEENFKKTYTNPETLSQFRDFIRVRGRKDLSPEQKIRYDELVAEETKAQKAKELEEKGTVTQVKTDAGMKYTETKHTKTGVPLHVVSLDSRVDREVFNELNRKAKMLGGYYSSFRGAGAVPGFQFKTKEAADQFMALKEGDVSRATTLKERQAESKQTAAERLREMAEKIEEKANESLNRDRLANTVRRARMAASAEESARSELAFAETMKNLAEAIASGQAKHLDGIKAQTHIQLLNSLLNKARLKANEGKITNDMSYSERESIRGRAPELSDIEFAEYPYPEVHADRIQSLIKNYLKDKSPGYAARLDKIIRETPEHHGYKLVKFKSDRQIDLLRRTIDKLKSLKADEYDLRAITEELADYDRIKTMGIDSLPHLRAALREYLQYKGKRQQADPIKEMERELIGTKIPGYFPTPKQYSQEVVDRANIKPGMDVLEPSAGKGNIADEVPKDVNLSVIEVNPSLREILTKKGYRLVGKDFLEHVGKYDRIVMNPPFENGQDIDHVKHAYELLKPGGRIVAIMSEGPFFRSDKKATEFREWLESVGGISDKLPEGAFKSSERPTGVNTRMVVIDKAGEAVSGQNKPDLTKLESAAKEAGFKDLDEAVLAFQAKKNGAEWFAEQEGAGSGEKYTELISKVNEIAPEKRKEFEFDLQMFAKKDNSLPIEERNYEMVSKRDVRAYQQLHPDLADFIQAEAIRIIGELSDTIKGEKFVTHVRGEETVVTGVSKMTSETIQRIQDATGASYVEIGEALEAIAKGAAGINTALAKKIELIIDDNLTNGVTDIRGNKIEPDASYKFAKENVKPITDLELYDAKQIEKLKAKYEARIARLKERDRARLERQIKQIKESKADAIKKLREFYKQREQRLKEELQEKKDSKREALLEKRIRDKMISNIKKVSAKLSRMRPEFQRPVKAVLEEINLVKPTKKTLNKLFRIAQYLEANPDNKVPAETTAKLKRLGRKNIRDMTTEEIKVIHDTVLHYVHLNIVKNKLIMNQRYVEFNKLKSKLIENLVNYKNKRKIPAAEETTAKPSLERNRVVKFLRKHLHIENLSRELDGAKKGAFFNTFYEGADEARDLELDVHYTLHDFIRDELRKLDVSESDIMDFSELFNTRADKVTRFKVKLENGHEIELTKADRIALYLHSLNQNNRASILKGGVIPDRNRSVKWRFTSQDLTSILGGMTDAEKKVAYVFHRAYNELSREYLNEKSLELDGFERAMVDNYYPKSVPEIERKFDSLKMRDNPFGRFTVEGMGFLKERTGAKTAIILEDAFKTMFKHVEGLAAYYGRATYLRNAKMVLKDKAIRRQMESIDNGFTWRQFEKFVEDQEAFGYQADDIDKVVGHWLTKIDTGILGLNAKVILKQFMSYPLMFNHINPKYLIGTIGKKASLKDIAATSLQLRQRIEGAVSIETGELGRVGAVRRFFTGKEAWGSKLTRGIELADNLQLMNAWNAVVAETKDLHPELDVNGKEFKKIVVKRVEELFRHSQSVFDSKDRSEFGRSKNLGFRIVTRFTSQRNVIFNEIYRTFMDWEQSEKTKQDYARAMSKMFNVLVVGATLEFTIDFLWRQLTKKRDDEDRKFNPIDYASNMLGNWLSYVYGAGEVYNIAVSVANRGDYGVSFRAPLFDAVKELGSTVGYIFKAIPEAISKERYVSGKHQGQLKWQRSVLKAVQSGTTFFGQMKGLPVGTVVRQMKPFWDKYLKQETRPRSVLRPLKKRKR